MWRSLCWVLTVTAYHAIKQAQRTTSASLIIIEKLYIKDLKIVLEIQNKFLKLTMKYLLTTHVTSVLTIQMCQV